MDSDENVSALIWIKLNETENHELLFLSVKHTRKESWQFLYFMASR